MTRHSSYGLPARFDLHRYEDVSGVSGTGVVAQGTLYPGGQVTLCWRGDHPSVTVWPNVDALVAVHGHEGATAVRWVDPPAVAGTGVQLEEATDGHGPLGELWARRHRGARRVGSRVVSAGLGLVVLAAGVVGLLAGTLG